MSGNRVGLKSAKGTSTSGFVTRSRVKKCTNKQHRYLHESDMEDSDEEVISNKRQINIQDMINNKKVKLNVPNKGKVFINKYYNKFIDFVEDNDIDLGDAKDGILKIYKQKLIEYYKEEEKELPLDHDLCNFKRQVMLLTNNKNVNISKKPRLEY